MIRMSKLSKCQKREFVGALGSGPAGRVSTGESTTVIKCGADALVGRGWHLVSEKPTRASAPLIDLPALIKDQIVDFACVGVRGGLFLHGRRVNVGYAASMIECSWVRHCILF